jgi:hypothetical protein
MAGDIECLIIIIILLEATGPVDIHQHRVIQ